MELVISCVAGTHWRGKAAYVVSHALLAVPALHAKLQAGLSVAGWGAIPEAHTQMDEPFGLVWVPGLCEIRIQALGRRGSVADDGAESLKVDAAIFAQAAYVERVIERWALSEVRAKLEPIRVRDEDDPIRVRVAEAL